MKVPIFLRKALQFLKKIRQKFLRYFFPVQKIHAIEESTLLQLLEIGKSRFPYEYMCLLLAEHGIINEIEILPGSGRKKDAGDLGEDASYVLMDFHPLGMPKVGTAHSHPNTEGWPQNFMLMPSDTDYATFAELGDVHIIVTNPFDEESWRAFNRNGDPISLEIVKDETNSGNGYF